MSARFFSVHKLLFFVNAVITFVMVCFVLLINFFPAVRTSFRWQISEKLHWLIDHVNPSISISYYHCISTKNKSQQLFYNKMKINEKV